MSVKLLDRTRKIGRILRDNQSERVLFDDICSCLGGMLKASVMVVSRKGKLLGVYLDQGKPLLGDTLRDKIGERIDPELNERFLDILSANENIPVETLGFQPQEGVDTAAVVLPISWRGERLGTTFLYRYGKPFSIDDIILCEYGNTVVQLEMLRSVSGEDSEEERKAKQAETAANSLTVSERKAMGYILDALPDGDKGTIVTSRLARECGMTRSIFVNAIQKLESAEILSVESRGMKGTTLIIRNAAIRNFLKAKQG